MSLTYTKYLKIDELLRLQSPASDPAEHDEMLFIVIHQTYELWFRQILHEFDALALHLRQGRTWRSVKTMRRVLTILKTLVSQVDILETMTPLEFQGFRGALQKASGFQSAQFRELEILCGNHSEHALRAFEQDPAALAALRRRMRGPTLWEGYRAYLQARGHGVPPGDRAQGVSGVHAPCEAMQAALSVILREDQEAALLAELFVDFDEGMQEWRYRHLKMVERTIGTKPGTGGSAGAEYLRSTLHRPVFPDLWEVRSLF